VRTVKEDAPFSFFAVSRDEFTPDVRTAVRAWFAEDWRGTRMANGIHSVRLDGAMGINAVRRRERNEFRSTSR
jgi:hypothetical protein